LVFIYGPAAAGKLTIAREVARRTGLALFHNHLIVDAVAAVFPFGSDDFIRLRERFWLETIETAARTNRSMIFTFAPEPSVAPGFAERVVELVGAAGGKVMFVALTLGAEEQERRLIEPSRAEFGKLRSVEILRDLRAGFDSCLAAMPDADVRIDTGSVAPGEAADQIVAAIA